MIVRLGQTYTSVPTTAGDFQVLSDGTVFDPAGNIVTDFSTLSNSVSNAINSALNSMAKATGGSSSTGPGSGIFLWAVIAVVVLGLVSRK
jgi:hypothetical protein